MTVLVLWVIAFQLLAINWHLMTLVQVIARKK